MVPLTVLLVLAVGDVTGHVEEPSCPAGHGEECANQGMPSDYVALLQTRATMHSSAAHSEAPEERTLNITFDNEDEAHQAGLKITQAFKDAGLNMNEWEEVGESDDSDGEAADSDGSKTITFPMVMPYRIRRIPAPPSSSELIETDDESLQAALDQTDDESLQAALDQEQEEYQAVSNNTGYQAVSEEEMEVYLNMEAYDETTAKKNKKQKAWAAKAISKLQGEVCKRDYMNKYAAYAPSSALIWCWESCWTGMEKRGCICYDPCPSGWHHALGFCAWNCPSQWTDDGTTCTEWCSVPGLEHLNTHCGISYCADSDASCVAKVAKISLSFIDMMANFVPGGKAMTGLKKAAQTGSKLAIKAAIKAAAKDVAKRLMKKAKSNLYKHMKSEGKELSNELKDAILEGGIEEVTEVMVAKTQTGALKDAAVEMIKAVDPTGIADVVDAFQADGCEDKKITPMPDIEESCDEALSGSRGSGYRGCQYQTRSGKTCQKWTAQSPQKHSRTPSGYPNKGLGDHNSCRNPDGESSIWCYTTSSSKRWELCAPR